ncbi:rCG41559 [Rattus norvegicus]|uniref:RCG41559 n=1 Tax=Rattus norvegicus TaxID=10116 RepID=A6IHA3_RAT|nr:rCG41559 [Rattus norvegicus]
MYTRFFKPQTNKPKDLTADYPSAHLLESALGVSAQNQLLSPLASFKRAQSVHPSWPTQPQGML